jgi:hypothetical protein
MWGVVGEWTAEYTSVLGDNAGAFDEAIQNAEAIVNEEQPAEGEAQGDIKPEGEESKQGEKPDEQKIFEYDLSPLKGLFSAK